MTSGDILIIGAGIGGLTLAQGLKKSGVPFKIFEKGSRESMRQGYRLRINPDGSKGLKQVLTDELWNLFVSSCARMEFGMTNIDAITGEIKSRSHFNRAPSDPIGESMTFTADRTTLRNLLMIGLDNEIQFNKSFESYEKQGDDGSIIAKFSDGTTFNGGLLVGADGINSKVAKQFLPNKRYLDTGGRCIYGKTPITNELLTVLPASIMEWTTIISSGGDIPLTLFMEPIKFKKSPQTAENEKQLLKKVDDYIYWVLLSQDKIFEKTDREMYLMDQKELQQHQLHLIKDWNDKFKNVIKYCDIEKSSYFTITSSKPDIEVWETDSNITLLGDSIHAMPPTGGVGANSAINDGVTLFQAIKNGHSLSDLSAYENKMRKYSENSIRGSISGSRKMFGFKSIDDCKYIQDN